MKYFLALTVLFFSAAILPGQISLKGSALIGTASGSGYWTWTTPQDEGNLFALPGFGLGLGYQKELSRNYQLEGSIKYIYSQTGQRLNDLDYIYKQHSFELPLLLKMPFPSQDPRIHVVLGPTAIWLPLEAQRVTKQITEDSYAQQPLQLAITAGIDYTWPRGKHRWTLSLYFIHSFTSPEYTWNDSAQGNFRINHFDLTLSWPIPPFRRMEP
ncbi:MAG: hypothetical protein PF447_14490 [Spirochaetaceae bacterium]|jgi:hypothetical protein|nr:hypothetical protein [Spirochaetaceae bacterium]